MSQLNHVIVVSPDPHSKGETFTIHGVICPVCNGNKTFSEQTGYEEYKTTQCEKCGGKGKLEAKIVIGWVPDSKA